MTKPQIYREIRVITKLLDEVEAMAHYQIVKAHEMRDALARLARFSKQVEAVEGGGERLAGGGEFVGEGANAAQARI